MTRYYTYHDAPTGRLLLASDGHALTDLHMVGGKHVPAIGADWVRDDDRAPFPLVRRELDAYFAGRLRVFTTPIALHGTDFQKAVWQALLRIPYGETRSYGQQAAMIGRPRATRAVGAANGRNPISIIVPCHRVVGSDGTLTGYGGGMDNKRLLLRREGVAA